MHIAIVGSRNFPHLKLVSDYVALLPADSIIVSGNARGVDRTAEEAARACSLQVISLPADWNTYGRSAGYKRNAQIVALAERLVAFWDGASPGTQHSINLARHKGIEVEIIRS